MRVLAIGFIKNDYNKRFKDMSSGNRIFEYETFTVLTISFVL
jgi:hypothetical protein